MRQTRDGLPPRKDGRIVEVNALRADEGASLCRSLGQRRLDKWVFVSACVCLARAVRRPTPVRCSSRYQCLTDTNIPPTIQGTGYHYWWHCYMINTQGDASLPNIRGDDGGDDGDETIHLRPRCCRDSNISSISHRSK